MELVPPATGWLALVGLSISLVLGGQVEVIIEPSPQEQGVGPHEVLGHEPLSRATRSGISSAAGGEESQAEAVFLDVSMCFNRSVLVTAIEFFVADVTPIRENRFQWRILHPIPSISSSATQWFRLKDAWPVVSPQQAVDIQMPKPGSYRATLRPPVRLNFGDCLAWSMRGKGNLPLPFDYSNDQSPQVSWATSSDGLHDAVELFVKQGIDPVTAAERKDVKIGWTGLERRTYSVRLLYQPVPVQEPPRGPQPGKPQKAAPIVPGGNAACWRGGFTFERCCLDAEGPSCWDSKFTFERCCTLTTVKRYADFDFTPAGIEHYELRHLQRDNPPRLGPVQDDEALLLYSFARAMRPRTIVEFGTSNGFSAINWMHAIADDPEARVFSYDILPYPSAEALEDSDSRFVFLQKSQTDFEPGDVEHRPVDLAFFDAGHLVEYSLKAFELISPWLSPTALVAVHDTGLHVQDFGAGAPPAEEGLPFSLERCAARQGGASRCHRFPGCDGDNDQHGHCIGRAHRPSERLFVEEVLRRWPEFRPIHVHSRRVFRHGLTLLQRGDLWTPSAPHGVF